MNGMFGGNVDPMILMGLNILANRGRNVPQSMMQGMQMGQQMRGQNQQLQNQKLQQQMFQMQMAAMKRKKQQEAQQQTAQQNLAGMFGAQQPLGQDVMPYRPGGQPGGVMDVQQGLPDVFKQMVAQKFAPTPATPTGVMQNYAMAKAQGYPGTLMDYQTTLKQAGKTDVNVNTGGAFKLPLGYMMKAPGDPAQGVTPIPGGPAVKLTVEAAAKKTMIDEAIKNVADFKTMLIDPSGDIDRVLLGTMDTRLPFSQGREAYSLVYDAIEAKLRAESGAAVPEPEVVRMAKRLIPGSLDNDSTIKRKLQMLDGFLSGTKANIERGRGGSATLSPADQSELEQLRRAQGQ